MLPFRPPKKFELNSGGHSFPLTNDDIIKTKRESGTSHGVHFHTQSTVQIEVAQVVQLEMHRDSMSGLISHRHDAHYSSPRFAYPAYDTKSKFSTSITGSKSF